MNSEDKDFIDKFFDYIKPYRAQGVRFFLVVIWFLLFFILGTIISPYIIKICKSAFVIDINLTQLTPFEALYNYLKIGCFLSLFTTLPVFTYQFGKLKVKAEKFEDKINLLYSALILAVIIILAIFLTIKFIFPVIILFLYGMSAKTANFMPTLTSMVSIFIFTLFCVFMVLLLPVLRYLIKKSLFFNYAAFIKNRKTIIIYTVILTALIFLPVDILLAGFAFLAFFLWYKVLVNFSKKRD